MRKTKIICTIGPASESEECMKELMLAGMNVARFNFSHGTREEQKEKFERLVKVRTQLGVHVATLLDTKGPEIRLRDFEGGKVEITAGQTFTLTTDEILGTAERASITYKNLKNDISVGTTILIDDGLIEMCVQEIQGQDIVCRVINGGVVSNHKGVNVPGAVLSMPYISETDREDIIFGARMGYEFLAASFTRCKEDVLAVRELLQQNGSDMKIIAKIENMQGIQNLEEILSVSDGIMVARGDMGVEIPLEEVPGLQKKMIKMANIQGKHVITATQMLESMIKNPRPTRAEATDIANAIYDGTTAIMLSGESAAGLYPVEAVKTMSRIAESAERDIDYQSRMAQYDRTAASLFVDKKNITTAIAHATCHTAMDLEAAAIITVTLSGFTAEAVSRFKPGCPIIGCTMSDRVAKQLNLLWGVTPLVIREEETTDELFADAVEEALKTKLVKYGDKVVITAGVPMGITGNTNMIRVVEV
ncbi:MAG: pyruvate kinase [Acetatifactor muris]|nr:pyruvate kinase [Acetatifactor muris]MCM1526676.1 pyruvate kinase [Bacteroides sp.]